MDPKDWTKSHFERVINESIDSEIEPPTRKLSELRNRVIQREKEIRMQQPIEHDQEGTALWVDKYYVMNWRTEKVVYGRDLREGHLVLAADFNRRQSLRGAGTKDEVRALLRVKNRFCRVTELHKGEDGMVHFIGVYADGMEYKRDCDAYDGWVVKRYSILENIPTVEEDDDEQSA